MPYADPETARAYKAEWARRAYAKDPEKFRAIAQQWRQNNPEKQKEIGRKQYAKRGKEQMREWRANNPDGVRRINKSHYLKRRDSILAQKAQQRLENPEPLRAASLAWKKANPGLNREHVNARRARKANPPWADKEAIKDFYRNCPANMVVDHIVPLNGVTIERYPVSGLHVPWNLQYLTSEENSKKKNRMRATDDVLKVQKPRA